MNYLPFKKILAPTDFSDPARNALFCAVEIAQQFSAQLFVVNVTPPVPGLTPSGMADAGAGLALDTAVITDVGKYQKELKEANRQKLDKIVSEVVPDGLSCSSTVEMGDPRDEIIRFAEENDIDLIVISTHGLTGVSRFLMGSVSEGVVRSAPVPVMVVRHGETGK